MLEEDTPGMRDDSLQVATDHSAVIGNLDVYVFFPTV
jgi:hypothetical protein